MRPAVPTPSPLDTTPLDVAKPEPADLKMWSVTTIIGVLDKPALVPWAANQTAAAAVKAAGSLPARIEEDGPAETAKWLANARYRRPEGERGAAELGTAVHDACEQYALTGVAPAVDAEVQPFLDQFDRWVQQWQPEYLAAELTIFSPTYGYAGTCDGFFKLGGRPLIFDYKTSRKAGAGPYPEVALQLAAYRYAELAAIWRPRRYEHQRRRYYLLGIEERDQAVSVPQVEGGVVIHLGPDHCDAFPVRCDEEVHRAFLYVIEAARWAFETSKSAIGDPLVHPGGPRQ